MLLRQCQQSSTTREAGFNSSLAGKGMNNMKLIIRNTFVALACVGLTFGCKSDGYRDPSTKRNSDYAKVAPPLADQTANGSPDGFLAEGAAANIAAQAATLHLETAFAVTNAVNILYAITNSGNTAIKLSLEFDVEIVGSHKRNHATNFLATLKGYTKLIDPQNHTYGSADDRVFHELAGEHPKMRFEIHKIRSIRFCAPEYYQKRPDLTNMVTIRHWPSATESLLCVVRNYLNDELYCPGGISLEPIWQAPDGLEYAGAQHVFCEGLRCSPKCITSQSFDCWPSAVTGSKIVGAQNLSCTDFYIRIREPESRDSKPQAN